MDTTIQVSLPKRRALAARHCLTLWQRHPPVPYSHPGQAPSSPLHRVATSASGRSPSPGAPSSGTAQAGQTLPGSAEGPVSPRPTPSQLPGPGQVPAALLPPLLREGQAAFRPGRAGPAGLPGRRVSHGRAGDPNPSEGAGGAQGPAGLPPLPSPSPPGAHRAWAGAAAGCPPPLTATSHPSVAAVAAAEQPPLRQGGAGGPGAALCAAASPPGAGRGGAAGARAVPLRAAPLRSGPRRSGPGPCPGPSPAASPMALEQAQADGPAAALPAPPRLCEPGPAAPPGR